MTAQRARIAAAPAASVALATPLLFPARAAAHGGLVGGADLPIPLWLFAGAAVVVLVVTFVALAVLWQQPKLQRDDVRPLPTRLGRLLTHPAVEVICGALGVLLLGVTIWSGLAGVQRANENLAPTLVFVVFWVGLVFASALLGDVFRVLNPWRAIGRVVGWLVARVRGAPGSAPLAYPSVAGRWPAVAGLIAFTCLELVSSASDEPRSLAIAALVYSAITFLGMALYGTETWTSRGEAFSVYFSLFSRLSVLERRGRQIVLRRPLSALTRLEPLPGTVAMLAVIIGSVSFDGAGEGAFYQRIVPLLQDLWQGIGLDISSALELTFATGYVAAITIIYALYWFGVTGSVRVGAAPPPEGHAAAFVHSLVPIAFAYVAAHYISLLVYQGQAVVALASDPLGRGWDLFGTAGVTIDYAAVSPTAFWYIQIALVVGGHIAGLALAHDRALVLYGSGRDAVRSQYWLLGSMVVFTVLALWLLSQQNEG